MAENANTRRLTTVAGAAAIGLVVIVALAGVVLAVRGDRVAADAVATIEPVGGSDVRGTIRFESEGGGVRIEADLVGLRPGPHGFHIHEKGDCSAPDGSSAGDHFNPAGMPHAGPEAERRHAGDLGNIVADESGKAHLSDLDRQLALEGPEAIVGRAVIVHADRDDLVSQPSGQAGARVGCGVIRRVS